MAKPSNREKILAEGLRVVHRRGFGGASVRDIVQAAGVPQGSFTNHFASKEAFGLEILERYYTAAREVMQATLLNQALPPLQRLRAYIDASRTPPHGDDLRHGCLLGNFAAEAGEQSEAIRARLAAIFAELEAAVATCLRDAVAVGEVPAALDCNQVAGFVVSSLQGAILLAKAQCGAAPVDRFEAVLFGLVLRGEA